jgi:two-component system, chemotaxis family, CheB/CheR fusion protein
VWQRRPVIGRFRGSGRRPTAEERADDSCPTIVGVGASAGGLEAFTELLSHLPDDTGMAFVLIQHLDPSTRAI